MNQKGQEWIKKRYEDAKLAYFALMLVYPFGVGDLEGEIWCWVRGYENLYQISNYGRVKAYPRRGTCNKIKILKPKLSKNGYLHVCLSKNKVHKYFRIHRLVAEAFIPNPNNLLEVDHRFGNKFDNYYENLEWVTKSENQKRSVETGLRKTGEEHVRSKLTNEQVRRIRELYKPKDTQYSGRALAEEFGVSFQTISRVINRISYKNVD